MPYRCRVARLLALPLLALMPLAAQAHAAPPRQAAAPDRDAEDLARFEHRAALSRQLGATQMVVTEGLPLAMWEMDKDDPYPAWFVHHATLFKIFPPAAIQPYVDMAYAARVQKIVARRCAILRQHGLTAMWSANEPAVLPEPFFTAHPELRGPRIDQIARSRRAHFAPNVDRPEMLAMYRESVRQALAICPEIETFNWVTTDAGSGFDWAPGLYPGANGSSAFRDRPLADRVVGFMRNVQDAARESGHEVRVAINQIEPRQWMIPTFSPDVLENIIRKLPRGLAVNGHEGPDGRPFATGRQRSSWAGPSIRSWGWLSLRSMPSSPPRAHLNGFSLTWVTTRASTLWPDCSAPPRPCRWALKRSGYRPYALSRSLRRGRVAPTSSWKCGARWMRPGITSTRSISAECCGLAMCSIGG